MTPVHSFPRAIAASCLGLWLAACATVPEPVAPADSFCAVAHLIHPSPADTDETLRQVLAHNEKIRRLCGAHESGGRE